MSTTNVDDARRAACKSLHMSIASVAQDTHKPLSAIVSEAHRTIDDLREDSFLFLAARTGNVAAVNKLISAGAKPSMYEDVYAELAAAAYDNKRDDAWLSAAFTTMIKAGITLPPATVASRAAFLCTQYEYSASLALLVPLDAHAMEWQKTLQGRRERLAARQKRDQRAIRAQSSRRRDVDYRTFWGRYGGSDDDDDFDAALADELGDEDDDYDYAEAASVLSDLVSDVCDDATRQRYVKASTEQLYVSLMDGARIQLDSARDLSHARLKPTTPLSSAARAAAHAVIRLYLLQGTLDRVVATRCPSMHSKATMLQRAALTGDMDLVLYVARAGGQQASEFDDEGLLNREEDVPQDLILMQRAGLLRDSTGARIDACRLAWYLSAMMDTPEVQDGLECGSWGSTAASTCAGVCNIPCLRALLRAVPEWRGTRGSKGLLFAAATAAQADACEFLLAYGTTTYIPDADTVKEAVYAALMAPAFEERRCVVPGLRPPVPTPAMVCDTLADILLEEPDVRSVIRDCGVCLTRTPVSKHDTKEQPRHESVFSDRAHHLYTHGIIYDEVRVRMLAYVAAAVGAQPFLEARLWTRTDERGTPMVEGDPTGLRSLLRNHMDVHVSVGGAAVYVRDPFRAGRRVRLAISVALHLDMMLQPPSRVGDHTRRKRPRMDDRSSSRTKREKLMAFDVHLPPAPSTLHCWAYMRRLHALACRRREATLAGRKVAAKVAAPPAVRLPQQQQPRRGGEKKARR